MAKKKVEETTYPSCHEKAEGEVEKCDASPTKGMTCWEEVCVGVCHSGTKSDDYTYPSDPFPHEIGSAKKNDPSEVDTVTAKKPSMDAKFDETPAVGDSVDLYGIYCARSNVASVVTDESKDEERSKNRCTRTHCGVRVERETDYAETVAFTLFEEPWYKRNVTSKY